MLHTYTEANLRAELAEAREEIRRLKAELYGERPRFAKARPTGFSGSESIILHVLVRSGHATHDQLYDALYADSDDGGPEDWRYAIRSIVKHLRRKLRLHDIEFHSIYGEGYRMDEASRAKARELMRGGA